jgi:hypothetical protein
MSDHPQPPKPLMSAIKARDIARAHKSWAEYLAEQGLRPEAARAERDAQWWLTYALALAQIPPGRTD